MVASFARAAMSASCGGADHTVDPDAVIATFPGPAVLLDSLGRALAANAAGAQLAEELRAGVDFSLRAAVASVLADHSAMAREVELPGTGGPRQVFDVTLLPLLATDGTARVILLGRETTVERGFIDALVESRRLFKDLVACSSDFAWETDAEGRFHFVSRGALGYAAEELNGRAAFAMIDEEHGEPEIFPFDARVPMEDAEVWLTDAHGAPACLQVSSLPVFGDDGEYLGTRGVCRDVTEMRARDAALAREQNRSRLLATIMEAIRREVRPAAMLQAAASASADAFSAAQCWIYRNGEAGIAITAAARAGEAIAAELARRLLAGAAPGAVVAECESGVAVAAALAGYQGRTNGAIAVARPDAAFDEDEQSLLGEVADRLGIALEQVANTEMLERLSRTDGMTGLLNRRAFMEELERRVAHQRRTGRPGALMYIDLDNFKAVNDRFGHQRGDEAIRSLARIATAAVRVGDLAARLGGDEFALWLEEVDADSTRAKAQALVAASAELRPLSASPEKLLGISVGVARSVADDTLASLVARADHAMYQVKRSGKGTFAEAALPGAGVVD